MEENKTVDVPPVIRDLVERFRRNREALRRGQSNEAGIRQEYLDPFFKALNWDVSNEGSVADAYKEVVVEDTVRVGEHAKMPDYSFRIGPARKFFVEAKHPQTNILEDPEPAFQLRRYGWSAKLHLSVLTNFETLAIYDCRLKPAKSDKPAFARVLVVNFEDYEKRWDEVASVLSKAAVLRGDFDKFAESKRATKGTMEVDDAFLAQVEEWRDELARVFALRNPLLSQFELNFAVQRTIDRIVFLRICEDRGIEPYARLSKIAQGKRVYKRLGELFEEADDRYNSGLFYFKPEPGRHGPEDKLTLALDLDDKVLKEMIDGLYYPESPYEFSVLSADILGQVYERFLGRVIRLTKGHSAKVEEKPEVRHAGGVYYTPTFVVDYIVRYSLGKALDSKDPVEAAKLRVLDPACGSGSFLIAAYQFLLDWHRDWYLEHEPKESKKDGRLYEAQGGKWRLSTKERKRILLNSIYGVDIDPQAVEVTKLSLLLKVLEGESEETLRSQLRLFHERALPDLAGNIKCGNSLIGPEFYSVVQTTLDGVETARVNAFAWDKEFPQAFGREDRGFDVVLGNPPYLRIQTMKQWAPIEVDYYKEHYSSADSGNYDIYVVFVEKGMELLNKKGYLGFILPHKFFTADYGRPLRQRISDAKALEGVVHFGEHQIFAGATTYTCLLFLARGGAPQFNLARVEDIDAWRRAGVAVRATLPADRISGEEWHLSAGKGGDLSRRLHEAPRKLADVANIFVGTQTSADDVFVLSECTVSKGTVSGFSKSMAQRVEVELGATRPFLRGKEIRRYMPLQSDARLICPYVISSDEFSLIPADELKRKYPKAFDYLETNRSVLDAREKGRFKGTSWYQFGYPKSMILFDKEKIVVPDYNNVPSFTYDRAGNFYKTGYGVLMKDRETPAFYVLGLLNSSVLFWQLHQIGTKLRGGYVRFWTKYLEQLPVPVADRQTRERVVAMVTQLLSLHQSLSSVRTAHEAEQLRRQVDTVDQQLEGIVAELFNLTVEERAIVEAFGKEWREMQAFELPASD